MDSYFSADFFGGNRQRLKSLFIGTAPIVITANGLLQRNGDNTFAFRQDSSFWYLTGINEPDIILVMDKEKEYLVLPSRSTSREAFDGVIDSAKLAKTSGIDNILDEKTGWKQINSRLSRAKHVATLAAAPTYVEAHGVYVNPARRRLIKRLKEANPTVEPLDLRKHLSRMRMTKQPEELAAIRAAIDITISGFKQAKKYLPKAQHEYELEAVITNKFRSSGVHHAYPPIVAAGANACTLHYVDNNANIGKSRLILMDVGAEISNYAADISRTYAAAEPNKRVQQVWQAVIDIQEFAKELLGPGTVLAEYEKKVEAFMGEKLRELGLVKTIEHDTVRRYYPHATSHFLGLDVHDTADYERPLEPGMVLTIEPGIYISEEEIGIRIEDDILITESGLEVLSKKLPRDL